ncbi:MAG TPA: hypothetical protein VIV11_12110 [Kofleriaceae bacterium]
MAFLVACTLLASGCSHVPRSGARYGTEVSVWVYETFPPEQMGSPARFRMTADELARVNPTLPDVSTADDHACKCGVPRFGIELYEKGATKPYAEGHFFHGPDELTLSFDERSPGRLKGQTAFHDAIVAVIQARNLWK